MKKGKYVVVLIGLMLVAGLAEASYAKWRTTVTININPTKTSESSHSLSGISGITTASAYQIGEDNKELAPSKLEEVESSK